MNAEFQLKESDILFLDNHLLVVNKPPGILVQHDPNGGPNVEDAAKIWLKQHFQKPGNVFATATHRLDRPVGGLVIIARTSKALARMNAMFANREIKKLYLALVQGQPQNHEYLRHWIKNNEAKNKVWTYTYPRGDARQADLAYWQMARQKDVSLLIVRLFTGRHHQIRAQLSFSGFPILGDSKYGQKHPDLPGPALFSYAVYFAHPVSQQPVLLQAPIPDYGPWIGFSAPEPPSLEMALQAALPQ